MSRRWVVKEVSVLSLLLCIATAAMWVRSYFRSDAVERYVNQHFEVADWDNDDVVYSYRGLIIWDRSRHADTNGPLVSQDVSWNLFHPAGPEHDPEPQRNVLTGVHALSGRSTLGIWTNLETDSQLRNTQWHEGRTVVIVPYRVAFMLFAIPPAVYVGVRILRRKRIAGGACGKCGYNLNGNISGVCPECGTLIPTPTPGSA